MPAAQSNSIMPNPDSAPNPPTSDTSNPTSQGNAPPTGNRINHGIGPPSAPARAILPEMTDRDRMEMGVTYHSQEPLHLANLMNGDTTVRAPNNTPHVNGEDVRRDHRAEASNIVSHNQPTPTNLDNILRDWSADERQQLEDAINFQHNEPSAGMDEFWTLQRDGFDPFNTTPASHMVTNGNSTLREEDQPARLSDYLPQDDPATQEQWQNVWEASISAHASHPTRHLNTPLLAGDGVENDNARAQRSLYDEPSVYLSDLQLGAPTEDRLAVSAQFTHYSEDEASNAAPGEDTTASGQTDLTTPTPRRNPRAVRRVGPLRRMTSEENRAFWRELNDSENERGST